MPHDSRARILLTSAATVQGFKARNFVSVRSLHGPPHEPERRHVAGLFAAGVPHDWITTGVVLLAGNGLSRLQAGAPSSGSWRVSCSFATCSRALNPGESPQMAEPTHGFRFDSCRFSHPWVGSAIRGRQSAFGSWEGRNASAPPCPATEMQSTEMRSNEFRLIEKTCEGHISWISIRQSWKPSDQINIGTHLIFGVISVRAGAHIDAIRHRMKRHLQSRIFQLVAAGCEVYLGLGWPGVLGGFTNTDSTVSRIGGVIFLFAGIAPVSSLFQKT